MIKIEGARNIRDLGGITTNDGHVIKEHFLIRSNHIASITDKDAAYLSEEYKVRKIIDLRTAEEVEEKPDKPISGAEWINIPVFTYASLGITHEDKLNSIEVMVSKLPDLAEIYRTMVSDRDCIENLRQILLTILNQPEGAVLWHCTEGKDRCGIVTALILSILDVPYKTIMNDYMLTNKTGRKRIRKIFMIALMKTKSIRMARRVRSAFIADTDYLNAALDQIRLMSGSVDNYLQNVLHIDAETRKAFKDKICE